VLERTAEQTLLNEMRVRWLSQTHHRDSSGSIPTSHALRNHCTLTYVANQGHQQLAAFKRSATILMMLLLADSEVRMRIYDAAIEVSSFDERHSIGDVLTGIHDANGDASVFGEKIAEQDDIPIVRQFFDARICEMSASDFLWITRQNPAPSGLP
jgi:hypothetical protein